MVDYNIGIPQQQYFQAPDLMQNAMRMQQMQTNALAMQEVMRKRQEESALRGITADPSSPEYVQQLARISPELGMKALNMQRQNTLLEQQTRAAGLTAAKTGQEMRIGGMDLLKKHTDLLPGIIGSARPEESWATWRASLAKDAGEDPVNVPVAYPGAERARAIMDRANEFLTRTKPERAEIGGRTGYIDPATNVFRPAGVVSGPPQGVPSSPMRPAAAANITARGPLYAPDLTQSGGGARVNAMAPEQPAAPSPYGGINALAPGGQIISQEEFSAPQEARALQRESERATILKRAQMQGEKLENLPKVQSSFVGAMAALERQRESIADLKSRPFGTQMATGPIMGLLPNIAPFDITGAGAAQARIDQVKSSAGLTALQDLKQSSPTGSGLGGVSNEEGRRLEASVAALSQRQGTADFNQAVDKLNKDIEASQKRLLAAYVREYGELPPDIQTQLPPSLATKAPAKGKLENRVGTGNMPSNVSVSGW